MARRDDLAKLRGLAGDVGYTVERAMRRNHWRLIDPDGTPAIDPKTGAPAFTMEAAMRFLGEVQIPAPPITADER